MKNLIYLVTLLATLTPIDSFSTEGQGAPSGDLKYYRLDSGRKDPNKPLRVVKLEAEAMKLVTQKKFREAEKKYTLALKVYPNSAVSLMNRALCYSRIGDLEKALGDYKKASALSNKYKILADQQTGEMYLNRGRTRIDDRNYRGAAADLMIAADYAVTKPRALSELAYIALQNRDASACIDMANLSASLDAKFTDPLVTMSVCHLISNNPKGAVEASTRALHIDPKVVGAYMNRMAAFVALKQCAEAKKDAAAVARLDSRYVPNTRSILTGCNDSK